MLQRTGYLSDELELGTRLIVLMSFMASYTPDEVARSFKNQGFKYQIIREGQEYRGFGHKENTKSGIVQ